MPAYTGLSEQIVEGHEDRIQRLEETQQKLVSQSTEALLRIEFVVKQVEQSQKTLATTLETSFQDLGSKLETSNKRLESLDTRTQTLEKKEESRSHFWDSVKKFGIPLIIAAGSVIATRFGEQIWAWIVG